MDPESKSLISPLADAALLLNSTGLPVVIAKIDVSEPGNQESLNWYNVSRTPSFIWFSDSKPRTVDISDSGVLNGQSIAKWVENTLAPAPAPASVSDDPCKSRRLGIVCLSIPPSALYALLAVVFVHLLQAVAWVVVSKRNRLFSLKHFAAVLLCPVFGLLLWRPLCRSSDIDPKNVKMLDNLI
jgi:hypothetical protein